LKFLALVAPGDKKPAPPLRQNTDWPASEYKIKPQKKSLAAYPV
jgi:hypothetical protein